MGLKRKSVCTTAAQWQAPRARSMESIAALLLTAGLSCALLSSCTSAGTNDIQLSGRIEGSDSHLGVTMPGRIQTVSVHEGETVHKGQVLLTLDDTALADKEKDAEAVLTAAKDEQKQTKSWLSSLKAAGAAVPKMEMLQASMRMASVDAQVAQAQAAKNELDSKRKEFTLTSPEDGICSASNVAVGEVAAPGQSLVTIVDINALKMRAFIPEGELSRIKIGSSATVRLDGLPNKTLTARVAAIDPQASFTPENVYFINDRVRQVFGITLNLDNRDGAAKPGMPADAHLAVNAETH